ncbi:hypothetical protein [Mesorhizobium temperatum]|uniref:Uncharacterized protein n=1 Tax=Mesorhizobium temperatum TaxID=241416 RepID=A0A271LHK1_9HYPH|nr:hypothetical protein [Mesorhizobium temperatum]PAQ07622.1 hypothetical protein CIT26_20020 [Mesorhizobium temperatum]
MRGKRPTVRKIKPLVSGETQSPKPEPAEIAGAERLRALAPEKIQDTAPILVERLWGILKDIREALEPHFEGKKVANGALVGKVEHPARRAEAELQSMAVFVEPNSQERLDRTSGALTAWKPLEGFPGSLQTRRPRGLARRQRAGSLPRRPAPERK